MNLYKVNYIENFFPMNPFDNTNPIVTTFRSDYVKADKDDEAMVKAINMISRKNLKSEDGFIENTLYFIEIVR